MRLVLLFLFIFSSCSNLQKDLLIDSNIHFYVGPRGVGKKPGLLLVPDCFGLSAYFRERADRLADNGFHVLAVDLNGEGAVTHLPGKANRLCENQKQPQEVLKKAVLRLKELDGVDSDLILALGYSKGADLLFELAGHGEDLKALILVGASLSIPTEMESILEPKVFVLSGALDPSVNSKGIRLFKEELKKNQISYEFLNIPGAKKGFYKPASTKIGDDFDLPFAYDEEADKTSFEKIIQFLKNTQR